MKLPLPTSAVAVVNDLPEAMSPAYGDFNPEGNDRVLAQALAYLGNGLAQTTTSGAAVASDVSGGAFHDISASANFTLSNPVNAQNGKRFLWRIYNSSGSDITVTPGAAFAFGQSVAAFPTVTAGSTAYIMAVYRTLGSGPKWDVVAADLF